MDFYFNLKEAGIYRALRWASVFKLAKVSQKIYLVFFILLLLLFLYDQKSNSVLSGIAAISFSLFASQALITTFFNQKLKNPKIKNQNNLAEFLDFETGKAVNAADKFARSAKLPLTNSTVLFYFLLENAPDLKFVFYRDLLDMSGIKSALKNKIKEYRETGGRGLGYTQDYQDVISESLKISKKRNHKRLFAGDVLTALAAHDPVFKKILMEADLKKEDMENLTWWQESFRNKIKESKKWWEYKNLMKIGTLAKEWTSGYTLTLDKYSIDWTDIAKKQGFPEIIGHKEEIEQVERALGRREYNNVLLVGEPGVGRKAVIQGLVERSAFGESLPGINYKRVVELDLPSLLAGNSDSERVESLLDAIFKEAISAGNVILIINEFHNYIAVRPGAGQMDISGIIYSYLHLPEFQVVAVTDFSGLHKNIEQNPSILNLFEKIEVREISEQDTLMILENLVPVLEGKYKLFVSYPALREIISLSKRFLSALTFPKKAADLLDEAMIYVKKTTKEKIVLPKHVAKIIEDKTQIPVGEMGVKEKEILLNLENLIHQRIINQEQAVREVSSALRRARAEIQVRSAPMGNFLFLGPTGVGKTETSKALAEIYFGSESKMIRLDMSEFQDTKDIARLIGSPGEEGLLTTKIRENPFSIILLDEIEKAHSNILNLFLQVLDEGSLTDGSGRKVDFKNSIIIATSNAGYQIILKALDEKTEWALVKEKLLDYIFEKAIFRPEFINRFDAVVVFSPLSKEHLLKISELMLQKIKKNLKEKGIEFLITPQLKEKIVELSYNIIFGAREMKRVIQDKVEDALAKALLAGELKRGNTAEIDPAEFKLKIQ